MIFAPSIFGAFVASGAQGPSGVGFVACGGRSIQSAVLDDLKITVLLQCTIEIFVHRSKV
jgi:hypothetical protein